MKTTFPVSPLRFTHSIVCAALTTLALLGNFNSCFGSGSNLINVNFGAHLSPGLDANKTSKAVIGPATVNTWNFYSRDVGSNSVWRADGALTGLLTAEGLPTSVGLVVSNAAGCWANGSKDQMYNTYIYPFSGNATVILTNLSSGQYDLYVYSHDGNYQVNVGTNISPVQTTHDDSRTNDVVWQAGRQYTRFANLPVDAGEPLVLTVRPGVDGYAVISGLQITPSPVLNTNPPLAIINQPVGDTVFAGQNVTLAVGAVGTPPLGYQWFRNGFAVAGATNSSLTFSNIQPAKAGHYSARVSSGSSTLSSFKAAVIVVQSVTNPLLNVTFGAHLSPGLDATKTGSAALGQSTNDFWNFYSRDIGSASNAPWRTDGELANLKFADGTVSTIGLTVSNAPGSWANGSTDPMYNTYLYPFSGNAIISMTNVPAGQYDLLVYSQDGKYQVTSGNFISSVKTCVDSQIVNPPTWTETQHYTRFTNVNVIAGNPIALKVQPGRSGYAVISGLQLIASSTIVSNPPSTPLAIVNQPTNQTVQVGGIANFSVTATGPGQLDYQWLYNGTNITGATQNSLVLTNVQLTQAGQYAARVSGGGTTLYSSNAALVVVQAQTVVTNPLLNVTFGAHLSPGLNGTKTGFAALGSTTNDFWNYYSRDRSNGTWQVDGALTHLKLADGTTTGSGLIVSNAPGAWGNGSSDPMYATYLYPFGGAATVILTNLPAGQYDLYVYSHDGNYQVAGANYLSPVKTTRDNPVNNPPIWQEGRHYARFTNVPVTGSSPIVVTVQPGVDGTAIIAGLQLVASSTIVSNPPSIPLSIVGQPTNQTVQVGGITHFAVTATGSNPLSYQWNHNGTNITWATGPLLVLTNVQPMDAGQYSVRVSDGSTTLFSSNATLLVLQSPTNTTVALLNVTFGAHLSPGLDSPKTGLAAIGNSANDFWNYYSRDRGNGSWQVNGALTGLKLADGSTTAAGLIVSNAPGAWGNGSSDPMYQTYLYPFSGLATVTVTNLPAGQYDLYVYSHDGSYQVSAANYVSPVKTTRDNPITNPPVWQEGRQYAVFAGLIVLTGQPLSILVQPGVDGYAVISGLQLVASSTVVTNPPSAPLAITSQPQHQTVFAGQSADFSVAATGPGTLGYQWRRNGTNVAGATSSSLSLSNVSVAQAGYYSVRITNAADSIISTNAALVVVQATTNLLFNITFGAHLSPGLNANKTGLAALGQTSGDFWNYYSRDVGTNVEWQVDGALTGLKLADGASTTAGLVVSNAPGAWGNGSSDPMYQTYLYPFSGFATVLLTNLPAGQYDLYVYSHDGNFEVAVGNSLSSARTTRDAAVSNPPVWQEGRQYTRFANLTVTAGQPLVLTVKRGVDGYAVISGLQLVRTAAAPPEPGPAPFLVDVNFGAHLRPGLGITNSGLAAVGISTNDFWNFYSCDSPNGADGALPGLKLTDGTVTGLGLTVSNTPGAWGNGSSDPMYNVFIYPASGNATVTITNVPAGQYDLYAYSHDANYKVTIGGFTSAVKTTLDASPGGVPVWQEGRQYVAFSNLNVAAGERIVLTVMPGANNPAVISGLQLIRKSANGGINTLGRLALNEAEKRVSFVAEPSQRYRVQASTDLTSWINVGTVLADDNGNCEFVDRDAGRFASRYYRVVP